MAAKICFTGLTVFLVMSYMHVTQQSRLNSRSSFSDFEGAEGGNASSGGGKRSRDDDSSQSDREWSKKKWTRTLLNNNTIPLYPEFTPEKIESVKLMEEAIAKASGKLLPFGAFKWHISELSEELGKALCIKAFCQESIDVDGISCAQSMDPDCEVTSTNGPTSAARGGARIYYGDFIYYLPIEEEGSLFYGDMVRCNCAYMYKSDGNKLKPVKNSKRFFFLLKQSENVYSVLTIYGDLRTSRRVRIINVMEYNQ